GAIDELLTAQAIEQAEMTPASGGRIPAIQAAQGGYPDPAVGIDLQPGGLDRWDALTGTDRGHLPPLACDAPVLLQAGQALQPHFLGTGEAQREDPAFRADAVHRLEAPGVGIPAQYAGP